ncbi:DUF1302 domain-containing protein [Solimonas marina]|uniref:DUF1302 domain-containing protein n=1 Tax=Solimonas marina TaxID=2714601 RepID=A0A969WA88_9GAMM|nr:DUF1302 family protein [Solimonas marina]NKF23537.1 DUF1302 domain-containing protein [Solimonas marina]
MPQWAIALLALLLPWPCLAFNFDIGDAQVDLNTRLTVGAGWRVEKRDDDLIGKLNVPGQQTLCQADDCMSLSGDPAPNQRLIDARGDYAAHAFDDGDLNYDRGDLYSALVKIDQSVALQWDDLTLRASYVGFYDAINTNFDETHPNTLLQPAHTKRSGDVEHRIGLRGEFRDAFVQYTSNIWDDDHPITLSVGAQRVRWGESDLHTLNTLDVINPQDAVLPRQPGSAINELSIPTPLVLLDMRLSDSINAQAFYQYKWNGARPEPDGTYFSSNDIIGGTYIEAAPGQFAEDPNALYQPPAPTSLLSSSTRRVLVGETQPRDQGQYGLRLTWYADNINNGTEFSLYYANYHSRLPYFSVIESEASCMRRAAIAGNFASALVACSNASGVFNGTLQTNKSVATEPIPVDTERGVLSYPENIHMFGFSFNTTVMGWAICGEYSFRPNLPVQLAISDVLYAGAQQAFPTEDTPLLGASLPGVLGTTIPGARTFLPDYITPYRGRAVGSGNEYQPGDFVRGWERLKVGQFVINALQVFPGRAIGADDITFLAEGGFTHIVDRPRAVYFQGQAMGSHPGPGADGSGPGPQTTLRLNPTQQHGGFASSFAWGLRSLVQVSYSRVFDLDLTLKPTLIWFEDVDGIAPFPMQNYVKGNRWVTGGMQFRIGQNLEGSLMYLYFDGSRNPLRDRDNVQVSLSYTY